MSKGQCAFKQSDVTRAVKAVVKAGLPVSHVVIENGRVDITIGDPGEGKVVSAAQAEDDAAFEKWRKGE